METKQQEDCTDVVSLRKEIEKNEGIILNYLQTAHNMKFMGFGALLFSIFLFIIGSVLSGFIGLVLAFLCLRKYNRSIGMAEIYNGATKFLKFMLHREITGDTSLPGFLSGTNK